jgi:hypothetical protein
LEYDEMQEEQVCETGFKLPTPPGNIAIARSASRKRSREENDRTCGASKKARNSCVFDDVAEREIAINDNSINDEGGYCADVDDDDEEEADEEEADEDAERDEEVDDEICRSIIIVDDEEGECAPSCSK